MVNKLIQKSNCNESGFYLEKYESLIYKLLELENLGKKIILIGVSYALLDLIEVQKINLKNTIIIETGGMKGQRKEMIKSELHEILKSGFGITNIQSEYGMTELLSQAYSKKNGIFKCPKWMKIFIRDINDANNLSSNKKTGGINIIDLANIYSCSFIATDDLGKKVADLDRDLKNLYKKWQGISKKLKDAKPNTRIFGELNKASVILRDLLNAEFNSIYVNNTELQIELKEYISRIAPDKEKIVKLHKKDTQIFQEFNVTKQIKGAFGKNVNMKKGTYLVIEHTEALHVIDVNSGKKVDAKKDQEENALTVNLEAAAEVARQLRLRDMGGIIVVDFIDMKKEKNRKLLTEKLKEAMSTDKAKHNVLPPTKFGLIQITRQRVKPEMNIDTQENCPMCSGNGKIDSSLLLIDQIETKIHNLSEINNRMIHISTHPFVASYINKKEGWFSSSISKEWSRKFNRQILVTGDERLHLLEYSVVK